MACVYRPVMSGKRKAKRSKYYWAKYTTENGERVREVMRLPNGERISDREVAEAELRRILRTAEREAAGLIDPLVKAAATPFRRVLLGYLRHMRALKLSPTYQFKSRRRIIAVARKVGFKRLGDINEQRIADALAALSEKGLAPKTLNHYRAAVGGLCNWAVKIARILPRNPVDVIENRSIDGDVRKERRALTLPQAEQLLAVAGPRALWYEAAIYTGLRCDELAKLQWRDLDLKAGTITLRAGSTKSKRADALPIRHGLLDKLVAVKPPFAAPTGRVFKSSPCLQTFRKDCTRAGIDYTADDRGRTLDRHALRTTFITWLSASGVTPRVAQMLARHTDMRLTMKNYTDPALLDARGGIDSLPELVAAVAVGELAATGTDRASAGLPVGPKGGQRSGKAGKSSVLGNKELPSNSVKFPAIPVNSSAKSTEKGGFEPPVGLL